MHPLPHTYTTSATVSQQGDVLLGDTGCPTIAADAPIEFDGPGERWSPETLLVAATLSCFAITFRGLARRYKLAWSALACKATGVLDRLDHQMQFTAISIEANLQVPEGTDMAQAKQLLTRADDTCLIANSLKASRHLVADIEVTPQSAAA